MTIGEYIKEKRIEKGLSQRELASVAGVSNAEISRIEAGLRKNPSPDVLKNISFALNLLCEKLYAVAGYMEDNPTIPEPLLSSNTIDVSELTKEEIADVKKYIQFLKSKRTL